MVALLKLAQALTAQRLEIPVQTVMLSGQVVLAALLRLQMVVMVVTGVLLAAHRLVVGLVGLLEVE